MRILKSSSRLVNVSTLAAVAGALALVACSSSEMGPDAGALGSGGPSCNEENPAKLAQYDAARGCFDVVAPVAGVCLSNLDLQDIGRLANPECAFDAAGDVYVRLSVEGEWLTGPGWQFTNISPTGPWPSDEVASDAQAATCERIVCAPDCATGLVPYAGQEASDGQCGVLTDGGATMGDR